MEIQTQFDINKFMDVYEKHVESLPQTQIPIENVIYAGVCVRRILIPKGCLITGAVHKKESIAIMLYGDMNMLNDDGSETRITGYQTILSKVGTRRMAYAHDDSMWIGVFATDADNIDDVIIEYIDGDKTDLSKITNFNDISMKGLSW